MYYAVIVLLMLVLPAGSAIIELLMSPQDWIQVAGKWFVFWAVGLRLLIAGVRQVLSPRFTADILKIKEPEALTLVRELGFGNLAIGAIATLSLVLPGWTLPAATAGGLFLALAGVQHVFSRDRNMNENWAMVSDLLAAIALALYVAVSLMQR